MSDIDELTKDVGMIVARLNSLERKLAAVALALGPAHVSQAAQAVGGAVTVADDSDLDSEWGDFVVKKDPSRWKGESYAGSTLSHCPSDYLRVLASQYDWMAEQDERANKVYTNKRGEIVPTAPFKRKDAARARGWAERNRDKVAATAPAAEAANASEEIPF